MQRAGTLCGVLALYSMACFRLCMKTTSLLAAYQAPNQTRSVWQQNLLSKTSRVPCSESYFLNGWRSIRSDKKTIRCSPPHAVYQVFVQRPESIRPTSIITDALQEQEALRRLRPEQIEAPPESIKTKHTLGSTLLTLGITVAVVGLLLVPLLSS